MSIAESLICNAMAVVWAAIALNALHAPVFLLLGPAGLSALLFSLTCGMGRAPADAARRRRVIRVIMISTLDRGSVLGLMRLCADPWFGGAAEAPEYTVR